MTGRVGGGCMPDGRLLVVDDEEHIRRLCAAILTQHGYEVVCSAGAPDALERCAERVFDLLVLDISLPVMDGFALLERIRERRPEMPAIAITGFATIENAVRAVQHGLQGFVVKPFARQELLAAVATALARQRSHQEHLRLEVFGAALAAVKALRGDAAIEEALERLTQLLQHATRSDAVVVLRADARGTLCLAARAGPDEGLAQRLGHELAQRPDQWRGLQVIGGRSVSPEIEQVMVRCGFTALINLPIQTHQGFLGILVLARRAGAAYRRSDLELSALLALQTAAAVERHAPDPRLRTSVLGGADAAEVTGGPEAFHLELLHGLARALVAESESTPQPSQRLLRYADALAQRLGLADDERRWLRYATALHQLGKVGAEDLVRKPERLSPEELERVKSQPLRAVSILRRVGGLDPVLPLVYHHRERYDGKGYPTGLAGDQIPIGSRIVAVLEAFEAMTSDRPYRPNLGRERAVAELQRQSGSQFDPRVVEAFLEVEREPYSH